MNMQFGENLFLCGSNLDHICVTFFFLSKLDLFKYILLQSYLEMQNDQKLFFIPSRVV